MGDFADAGAAEEVLAKVGPIEVVRIESIDERTARWVGAEEDESLTGEAPSLRHLLERSPSAVLAERARLARAQGEGNLQVRPGQTLLTRGAEPGDVLLLAITRDGTTRLRGPRLGRLFARLLDHCALFDQEALTLHGVGTELAGATPEEVAIQLASALTEHSRAPTALRRLELWAPPGEDGERLIERLEAELARATPVATPSSLLPPIQELLAKALSPPKRETVATDGLAVARALIDAAGQATRELLLELRARQPHAPVGPDLLALSPHLRPDGRVKRTLDELEDLSILVRAPGERPDPIELRGFWRRCVALARDVLFAGSQDGGVPPGVSLLEAELGHAAAVPDEREGEVTAFFASERDDWPRLLGLAKHLLASDPIRAQVVSEFEAPEVSPLDRLLRRLATDDPREILGPLSRAALAEVAQVPGSTDRETSMRELLGQFRFRDPAAPSAQIEGLTHFRERLEACARRLDLWADRTTLVGCMIEAGSTLERLVRRLLHFHCQARLGRSVEGFVTEAFDEGLFDSESFSRPALGKLLEWLERLSETLRLPDANRSPDRTGFSLPLLPFTNPRELAELRNLFGHDPTDQRVPGTRADAEAFFRMTRKLLTHLGLDARPLFPRVVVVQRIEIDAFGRRRYCCGADDRTEVHVIANERLELGRVYFVHPTVRPYECPLLVYPLVVALDRSGDPCPGGAPGD